MADNDRTLGLDIDVKAQTAGAEEAKAALDQVKQGAKEAVAAVDDVDARAKEMARETAAAAKQMAAEQRKATDEIKKTGDAAGDAADKLGKINSRTSAQAWSDLAGNAKGAAAEVGKAAQAVAALNPQIGKMAEEYAGAAESATGFAQAAATGLAAGGPKGALIALGIEAIRQVAASYIEAAEAAERAAKAEKAWADAIRARIEMTTKALEQTVVHVEMERQMQEARENTAKLEDRIREKMANGNAAEAGALAADKQRRLQEDGQGLLTEGSRKVAEAQMEQLKALAMSGAAAPEIGNQVAEVRKKLQADEDAQRRTGLKNLEELNKALETFAGLTKEAAEKQGELSEETRKAAEAEAKLLEQRVAEQAEAAEKNRQDFINNWRGDVGMNPGAPAVPGAPAAGGGFGAGAPGGGLTNVPPPLPPIVQPENLPDPRTPVQKLLGEGMDRTRAAIAGGRPPAPGGGGEEATAADAQEVRAKLEAKSATLKEIKKELDPAKAMEKEADGLVAQVNGLVQSFGTTLQGFKALITGLQGQMAAVNASGKIMDERVNQLEMRVMKDRDNDGKVDRTAEELKDLKQVVDRALANTNS